MVPTIYLLQQNRRREGVESPVAGVLIQELQRAGKKWLTVQPEAMAGETFLVIMLHTGSTRVRAPLWLLKFPEFPDSLCSLQIGPALHKPCI